MYKDDIKDLYKQKRESRKMILSDFLEIYFKLRLFFPQLVEERNSLINLVQMYFNADDNEYQVLKAISKRYGKLDEHDGVDELLEDFDEMYDNLFEYCQDAFVDYGEFLEMYGDFFGLLFHSINKSITGDTYDANLQYTHWMKMRQIDFQTFDEEYKQKVLAMIPNLPKVGDDINGEV